MIQYGDSVRRIATATKTPVATLLTLNGLRLNSSLRPGATLKLPATSVLPTRVWIVRKGDSFPVIARTVKVRTAELLASSKRTATSRLRVGDRLVLPAHALLPRPASPAKPPAKPDKPTKPTKPAPLTYTVRAGDSFIRIANRTGVKAAALLAANSMEITAMLRVGMVLTLPDGAHLPDEQPKPGPGPAPEPAKKPFEYRVRKGDMLSGIAHRAEVPLAELLKLNNLTATSSISPGDVLLIPAGGKDPSDGAPGQTPVGTMPSTRAEAIERVVEFARQQLGKPYKYFAAGPDSYDCSGLTMAAYLTVGIRLPHQSTSQSLRGKSVDIKNDGIQPGDLVFTKSTHGTRPIGHVSIAVSATKIIHAPRTGDVVRYRDMWDEDKIVAVQRYL